MTNTIKEATCHLFKIAKHTPFNIAPEKSEELVKNIFGDGKWKISPSETGANFYAMPNEATIYLSYAGLASLWCLSYSAFHIIGIASRQQRGEKIKSQTCIDIGGYYESFQLGEYISYARSLFHSDKEWPKHIEKPSVEPKPSSSEYKINNTFFGALSWIMLHEIAHVHNRDETIIPVSQRIEQEYKADEFATNWVLDEAGNGIQREFRILMISIALTWLFLNEEELGKGTTHPSAILRFREVSNQFQVGNRSVGLENSAYLLKAVLDPSTIPPIFNTAKEVFVWVSDRMEILFPE